MPCWESRAEAKDEIKMITSSAGASPASIKMPRWPTVQYFHAQKSMCRSCRGLQGNSPREFDLRTKKLTQVLSRYHARTDIRINHKCAADAKRKPLHFVVCFLCRSADLKPLISCYLLLDRKHTQARSELTNSQRNHQTVFPQMEPQTDELQSRRL